MSAVSEPASKASAVTASVDQPETQDVKNANDSAAATEDRDKAEGADGENKQKGEESKVGETGSGPRRSSRIKHPPPPPPVKAQANGNKRGPGRKRSAEEVETGEHAETGEVKKKVKTQKEEGMPLGSELPDLTLKNEKEEDVRLLDLQGEHKGVVFFLVPKADTPGCTTQACGFRDIYSEFEQHSFKVFCVSVDAPKQQAKWQSKKNLQYQLLSDPSRSFISALGAGTTRTARSHFIFVNKKLVDKKMPVKPADSAQLAIEFVKSFKGEDATASAEAKEEKNDEDKTEDLKEPSTPEKGAAKPAEEEAQPAATEPADEVAAA